MLFNAKQICAKSNYLPVYQLPVIHQLVSTLNPKTIATDCAKRIHVSYGLITSG